MTRKTEAERSKAKRIRRALRKGERVSAADRAWFERYDDDAKKARKKTEAPTMSEETTPAQSAPPIADADFVPIEDDRPEPEPAPTPAPSPSALPVPAESTALAPRTCGDPDCTACSGRDLSRPRKICPVNGTPIYGKISPHAGMFLASVFFMLLGGVIRWYRQTASLEDPTEPEVEDMSGAIREGVHRRIPQLAEYDDLLAAGWSLKSYVTRAWKAPKTTETTDADPGR